MPLSRSSLPTCALISALLRTSAGLSAVEAACCTSWAMLVGTLSAALAPSFSCRRISRSVPVPKLCTCAWSYPALARRARTSSTSTGLAKRSSTPTPPVKSRAKLKPLTAMAPNATNISSAAKTSDTMRTRMKSILLSYGNTLKGFMESAPSDPDRLQLAAAAIDQRGDRARDGYGRVGRRGDTQHRGDAEAAQRTGTERSHRQAHEERGDVGVQDGARGAVVTGRDRRLRWQPGTQLLAYALVDQHVGVDRHAHRQRDARKARQRHRRAEERHQCEHHHQVEQQR